MRTDTDWTRGHEAIVHQRCGGCGHVWAFRREFCPACGASAPPPAACAGSGTLHALTVVHRAPSEALRAHVPYTICLVDMDEGVRVMGHAEPGLAIGDRVQVRFHTFGDALAPLFRRIPSP